MIFSPLIVGLQQCCRGKHPASRKGMERKMEKRASGKAENS
jgi:hypothetical protein